MVILVVMLLFSLSFTSCTSNNEYLKYDMTQYERVEPSIPLEFQGMESFFVINSESDDSILYKSGIERWFGSVDELVKICNVKNSKAFVNNKMYITLPVLMDDGNVINTNFLIDIVHKSNLEGLLGLDFMQNFRYVTFDYKNNNFYLNGPKIKGSANDFVYDPSLGIMLKSGKDKNNTTTEKLVYNNQIVQFDMKKNKVIVL